VFFSKDMASQYAKLYKIRKYTREPKGGQIEFTRD